MITPAELALDLARPWAVEKSAQDMAQYRDIVRHQIPHHIDIATPRRLRADGLNIVQFTAHRTVENFAQFANRRGIEKCEIRLQNQTTLLRQYRKRAPPPGSGSTACRQRHVARPQAPPCTGENYRVVWC